jgi:hypothetical protein
MIEIILGYLFVGVAFSIWCYAWSYEAKIPLRAYFNIIIIWPYQLYLQVKK